MKKIPNILSTSTQIKALTYCRVSSKEQEREGFSIPAQKKLLQDYALQHNLHIDPSNEYVDVETAKQVGRTNFSKMIAFLKRLKEQKTQSLDEYVLLVEKTDRLYRNLKDWITIDELEINIHFVKDNFILSKNATSNEKFLHGIKVLMAKNYIDNLSEETKKGMCQKAEEGIYPSFAPLGYLNAISPLTGKKIILQDPDVAPLILRLFESYATATFSLFDLSKVFATEGLQNRKTHNKLSKSTIHKLLTNPIYYGDFFWKDKLYHGNHAPIVSKALFDKVQKVLSASGHQKPRPSKHHWLFQGLIYCGHCGCAMVAEQKKNKYIYYHCTGNKGACPERYVREEEISKQFTESLKNILIDGDVITWVKKALKESHNDEKTYHNGRILFFENKYRQIQKRLDALYIDKLDGKISELFFNQKNIEWRSEQSEIVRLLNEHQSANKVYLAEGIKLLELAQRAVSLYEKQNIMEKRRLLNFVYSNSFWKNGHLTPNFRKPFDLLAVTNSKYQNERAAFDIKGDPRSVWLPGPDSNQRQGG